MKKLLYLVIFSLIPFQLGLAQNNTITTPNSGTNANKASINSSISNSTNTDTRKCIKWSEDGKYYWVTKSADGIGWYAESPNAPDLLKNIGVPNDGFLDIQSNTSLCNKYATTLAANPSGTTGTAGAGAGNVTWKCLKDGSSGYKWFYQTQTGWQTTEGRYFRADLLSSFQESSSATKDCGTQPTNTPADAILSANANPGSTEGQAGADKPPSTAAFRPIDTQFQVGVTNVETPSSDGKSRLIVIARRKGTERLLGAVKVEMTDSKKTQDVTLSDPPDPAGQAIFEADPGNYSLHITRHGYKSIAGKEITIGKGKNLKMTIELEPESTTADPQNNYQTALLQQLYYQYLQSTLNPNYNNNQNPYIYDPATGQVIPNPFYNNNQSPYIYNPITGQYTPNPSYNQNGYLLSANQYMSVPIVIKTSLYGIISSIQNTNILLIDTTTGSSVSVTSSNPSYTNSSLYLPTANLITQTGCLKPNTPYILRIMNNSTGNYSIIGTNYSPYQDYNFTSPGAGYYVDVTVQPSLAINYGSASYANVMIQNYPISNSITTLGINCPSSYNQTVYDPNTGTYTNLPYSTNGTTTWTDQVVNPTNFGNYHVEQNSLKNGYYLVSSINPNETRQFTFIENGSGTGGLAFVPASSSIASGSSYSSQWYVTTYTRDINNDVSKCTSYVNNLKTSASYSKLDSQQQSYVTQVLNSISASQDAKANLNTCVNLRDALIASLKTADSSFVAPALDASSTGDPDIDISKFTRVNFTPQEYQSAVAGEVLATFTPAEINTSASPIPTASLTASAVVGNSDWTGQTVDYAKYHVEQNSTKTGWYLINNTNIFEQRQITFVDTGNGNGWAFVNAKSSASGQDSNKWYATSYSRNLSEQVSTCKAYLTALKGLDAFDDLTADQKTILTSGIDTASDTTKSLKTRLASCNDTKTQTLDNYQINDVSDIPAYVPTENQIDIDLSKLSPQNYTPEEFNKTVSGEVLTNF